MLYINFQICVQGEITQTRGKKIVQLVRGKFLLAPLQRRQNVWYIWHRNGLLELFIPGS